MKTKFSLKLCLAAFASISFLFCSCDKKDEAKGSVTYSGTVVYAKTTTPFPDLEVRLTDGSNVNTTTKTNSEGFFSVKVDLSTINGDYYFLVGDATCIQKKVEIPGWGQSEIDLGTIEVEGPSLPVVRTKTMTDVTAESAIGGGFVDEDGRLEVTARGICYSQSEYPTIEDAHTQDGTGKGDFTSTLKNLEHNVTYYVRAYATNKKGTSYGEQVKFSTELGMAVVTTSQISDIAAESAIGGGEISNTGGFVILERGVCWATHQYPSTTDSKQADGATGLGIFTVALSNLSPSTTYYVRAYATNENGTSYGETKTFTTTQGLPTVTTTDPGENITSTSIATGGNVTDDGGFTVTARGVVYSTLPYPTLENASKVKSGSGTGYFSANITNISPMNNTYYIRAYATNVNGTSYGEQITITPERSEYLSLPTIIYGGYKYHIYKDMGKGDWNTAMQLCDDLTFAGYDDWYLPDRYELVAMVEAVIDGWYLVYSTSTPGYHYSYYWTSSSYSSSSIYNYAVYGYYGEGSNYTSNHSSKNEICRFRAVRKDKI